MFQGLPHPEGNLLCLVALDEFYSINTSHNFVKLCNYPRCPMARSCRAYILAEPSKNRVLLWVTGANSLLAHWISASVWDTLKPEFSLQMYRYRQMYLCDYIYKYMLLWLQGFDIWSRTSTSVHSTINSWLLVPELIRWTFSLHDSLLLILRQNQPLLFVRNRRIECFMMESLHYSSHLPFASVTDGILDMF